MESKTRKLTLKNVPEDVFDILIAEQTSIKLEKRSGQFGLEQVIYKIVREFGKKGSTGMPSQKAVINLGKTPGDILGLQGKKEEKPSSN